MPSAKLPEDVVWWDAFPPARGEIRFLGAAGEVLAVGRFRVLLAYGPGRRTAMGWAVDAYRSSGIPVVPRGVNPVAPTMEPVTREQAQADGERLVADTPGAFTYWAGDVLLEVTDLHPADEEERHGGEQPSPVVVPPPGGGPVEDRALSDAEKLAAFRQIEALGLRQPVRTALIFALAGEEGELELSRNELGADDVDVLARAYWLAPTWPQRSAIAYLLQDQGAADDVLDIWLDLLRAPSDRPGSVGHVARAAALGWLRGDLGWMDHYLDDHDLLAEHARLWREVVRPPAPA